MEIFVDTPLAECERRDPKGLYRKARAGKVKNFTGIDSAYEPPKDPDIHLRTPDMTIDQEVDVIIDALRERGVFD
jgi:adenylylsulfate kinase-like enzyme